MALLYTYLKIKITDMQFVNTTKTNMHPPPFLCKLLS